MLMSLTTFYPSAVMLFHLRAWLSRLWENRPVDCFHSDVLVLVLLQHWNAKITNHF